MRTRCFVVRVRNSSHRFTRQLCYW